MNTLIGNINIRHLSFNNEYIRTIHKYQRTEEITISNVLELGNFQSTGLVISILPQESVDMKNPLLLGSRCYLITKETITELTVTGDVVTIPEIVDVEHKSFVVIDPPQLILDQLNTDQYRQTGLVDNLYTRDMQTMKALEDRIVTLERDFRSLLESVAKNNTRNTSRYMF